MNFIINVILLCMIKCRKIITNMGVFFKIGIKFFFCNKGVILRLLLKQQWKKVFSFFSGKKKKNSKLWRKKVCTAIDLVLPLAPPPMVIVFFFSSVSICLNGLSDHSQSIWVETLKHVLNSIDSFSYKGKKEAYLDLENPFGKSLLNYEFCLDTLVIVTHKQFICSTVTSSVGVSYKQ